MNINREKWNLNPFINSYKYTRVKMLLQSYYNSQHHRTWLPHIQPILFGQSSTLEIN